ncbi:MAG: YdcF family protein [Microgenomates group bacterium]
MIFDAAIVLGTGIKQDGSLPDSCLSNLKTAIKLYKDKKVSKLIFSGRWAWNCKFTPPLTEALAMKQIAISRNVPESDVFIEDKSVTTVSNICNLKQNILIPNNYKNIILVCISDIVRDRNEYNLKMVLGPEYTYDIVITDSVYTPEKYEELKNIETEKLGECKKFYVGIAAGDHQTILEKSDYDLQKNYLHFKT